MKKMLFLTILFLAGFVAGVVTMEILSRPAGRAYRETLQRNFVRNQEDLAYRALKEGNNLGAMVHLWTVVEAGPDGSELFKDPVSMAMDKTLFFISSVINNTIKNVTRMTPEQEERVKALPHGELAVVLEQLGYKEAAREHYLIASRFLNLPEDKARKFFQTGMKARKAQE
jgi:hypothetical protein